MCVFFLNVRGAHSRGTVVDWSSPMLDGSLGLCLSGFVVSWQFGPGVPRICPGDCLVGDLLCEVASL